MASTHCFVEWKEQFVSKERGNRVVHYFLKDITGESILAVVGTERSVRHMFYVVSEEFVNVHGKENWIYAGFRWRSRREVVNWLTSMLSKHHRTKSPKNDLKSGVGSQEIHMPEYKGCVVRSLKGHTTDIVWSGIAWTCGKQLKHYPSFCRNGIKIGTQSFVYVMAEEDSRYLAYVEDMYEDRKCQRKVKVRWFHHNREVKGVVSVKNSHPKEVFITPYTQVISAECVDGPAIVLTSEHYEKCLTVFPDDVLSRIHICFRQFKNNRVKPFKLSKFRGYFDQPIFSCFGPDFFEDDEVFGHDDNVKHGAKRSRTCRGRQNSAIESSYQKLKDQPWNNASTPFNVNERVEILCLDSGIRGCWFRCTVLQVSKRQIKVQYEDVKDEDGFGNLQEWIPTLRPALPDKLGMRYSGRSTIRPAQARDQTDTTFEIGAPVDAWWSDGWWEGVVTAIDNFANETHQVYIPSENLILNMNRENLRVSRDWMGEQWMEVKANPSILSSISSTNLKETKFDVFPNSPVEVSIDNKTSPICPKEEKLESAHLEPSYGTEHEDIDEKPQSKEENHGNDINLEKAEVVSYGNGGDCDDDKTGDNGGVKELDTHVLQEELIEVAA